MTERQRESERIQLFVVRLWTESFNGGRRVWRGEIVHTGNEGKRYFARWADLLKFICKAVGVRWDGRLDKEITTEVIDRELN